MKSGELIAGTSHRCDIVVRCSSLRVPPRGADNGGGYSVAGSVLCGIGGSAIYPNAHEEDERDRSVHKDHAHLDLVDSLDVPGVTGGSRRLSHPRPRGPMGVPTSQDGGTKC